MSEELKPCPFCGGEAVLQRSSGDPFGEDRVSFRAVCERPMCQGGACNVWEATQEQATAKWNARAAVTDEQFALAVHDGRAWQAVRECRVVGEWKRLSRTQEVKACSCSECGHEFGVSRRNSKPFAYEAPCELPNFCPNCGAKVAPC